MSAIATSSHSGARSSAADSSRRDASIARS